MKERMTSIKHIARKKLGQTGIAKMWLKDKLSIFLYHEVSDTPSRFCDHYDLNVPPKLFAEHMDLISDNFNIINPEQFLSGEYDTPAALITFDDGMPGYFRNAVPIMTEKQIPSIIFLNMAPIEGELFWSALIVYLTCYDNDFIEFLHKKCPERKNVPDFMLCEPGVVEDYLKTVDLGSLEDKVRDFYGPFADKNDLDSVKDNPFVFFGNHLYKHHNISFLNDEELREQYHLNEEKLSEYRNLQPLFAHTFGNSGKCFLPRQTRLIKSLGAKAVLGSDGLINKKGGLDGFYDRIGINSSIKSIGDLFGLMQWMSIKATIKGNNK